MASYYDQRPSSSDGRGYRPRNYHDPGRRSRDHSPEGPGQTSSRLRPDGRYYSNRFSYPTPQPSPRFLDPRSKRRSWPPSPTVEEEKEALAKEINPPGPVDWDRDEAGSRGTLDQFPIILDVPEEAAKALERMGYSSINANPDASHTKPDSSSQATQSSAAPNGEAEASSRGRSRTPPQSDFVNPSIFAKRQASPYVFTPKAPPTATGEYNDSGYFSSRSMKTPADFSSPSDKYSGSRGYARASTVDALRANAKPATVKNMAMGASLGVPIEHNLDEAIDSATDDESYRPIPDRKPARYSSVRTDLQGEELRNSLREMMLKNDQPRVAALKAETMSEPRRSSDGASTLAPPYWKEPSRKPAALGSLPGRNVPGMPSPLITPQGAPVGGYYASGNAYEKRDRSRPSSPTTGGHAMPMSPPRSPKGSSFNSKQSSPHNGLSSRPGSRPSSRPSSPSSSDHSRQDDHSRRPSAFPPLQDDRTQRTSRLTSSTLPPDSNSVKPRIQVMSPSPARPSKDLPYPDDGLKIAMPSMEQQRYDPGKPIAGYRNQMAASEVPRSPRGSPRPSMSLDVTSPVRPNITSRHTFTEGLPKSSSATSLATTRDDANKNSQLQVPTLASIRPCPRMQHSREFDDWYGLDGLPNFNICLPCLQANFLEPRFRDSFRRQSRKDRNTPVKCDFASPWMRVAWILTKQQRRADLSLLYTATVVKSNEKACPGPTRESRTWYTVLNSLGDPVSNFDVCSGDVKMIEELLPALRGIFVRGYTHSHKRVCDLRVDSKRFTAYLEVLIDINDKALRSRKAPDLQPFVELAANRAQTRECTRDDLLFDQCWHIIPQLPEFTVCEECYTDVVWPAIAAGSPIAARFARTPQLLAERRIGTSCQLYSDRMRHVFRKAVRNANYMYLEQRAKERRDVELELHAEVARVTAQRRSGRAEESQEELARISAQWQKWE